MLPLINTKDRIDLVFSTDPDVVVEGEAEPCRAIMKNEAAINGGIPLVVTVRPLNSHEALRVLSVGSISQAETVIRAAETATVRVSGEGIAATKEEEVHEVLAKLPPTALSALGAWIISASILEKTDDPFAGSE